MRVIKINENLSLKIDETIKTEEVEDGLRVYHRDDGTVKRAERYVGGELKERGYFRLDGTKIERMEFYDNGENYNTIEYNEDGSVRR